MWKVRLVLDSYGTNVCLEKAFGCVSSLVPLLLQLCSSLSSCYTSSGYSSGNGSRGRLFTANCQHGKLPSAASNPRLIDNNYRQNPLHYGDTAQQLLSVAQSEIQDSCRGSKCTNCIPRSLPPNSPSCRWLWSKGQVSVCWRHACTFGSPWQGY